MKIGKLECNPKGWYWNGNKLRNPIHILWNILILPLYMAVLFLFCVLKVAITLDITDFRDTWRTHLPF